MSNPTGKKQENAMVDVTAESEDSRSPVTRREPTTFQDVADIMQANGNVTEISPWLVKDVPPSPGGSSGWTQLSHPSGAAFVVQYEDSPVRFLQDATGADPATFPWTLSEDIDWAVGYTPLVLGRFASRDEAVDAVVHGVNGIVLAHVLKVAWNSGAYVIGMDLAMETCPSHGFGLLEHDEAWVWERDEPLSLGLTGNEETWVLWVYGTPVYAVVHHINEGVGPWRIYSVQGSTGSWVLSDAGFSFRSRHAAVARVESYRDGPLECPPPPSVATSEACCRCVLEVPFTLSEFPPPRRPSQ